MDKKKREQLEKRGWRIGTTEEFLNLSSKESVYIDLKLNLTNNLRELRKKYNLTQIQLAKLIHSSQSRVAKMEKGDPTVSIDLIIRTLITLGASKKDLARAISHTQKAT